MTTSSAPVADERRIATTVHGVYLVARPAVGIPRAALVGFHGYGETAADHLAALRRIPGSERWLLVAVQALHPFYRKDGTVVASWMTRFDREVAIGDNTGYAAAVLGQVARDFPTLSRWAVAGFSQGVAMAYRAAASSPHPIDALVALAGDVPPDVAAATAPLPAVLVGRGDSDSWYTDEKLAADLEVLAGRGDVAESKVFPGGHEWGEDFLAGAGEFLARHLDAPTS